MVDLQKVCSMCGDVGFPEKLFLCSKCHHRYQHSYCSNYYSELSEGIELCDWCQSEERNSSSRRGSSSRKSSAEGIMMSSSRSEYPGGDKIKQQNHDHQNHREESTAHDQKPKNNHGGAPSPRTSTRRYKLLKDVMC
ncbi:hypothetical protein R3W88_002277 [Solanum pinnatisectum]|uniref:PHD-type zinc finger plants domain-containing protein n=1 Tax=Solanum pinnatisectum TaxID=50273 RepID=A0AAV9MKM8_9SOLN|nr:hypothetical protein R3W88_002277 [Solanum pinnatisectum]